MFKLLASSILSLAPIGGLVGNINNFNNQNTQKDYESVLINRNFLAYYRAWRDVKMEGVNTTLPDKNWMSMNDIPYGINIVNIFSYVPPGQEQQAQPYFDALKNEYGPNLRKRGVKLIRGFDYSKLHSWWTDNDDSNFVYPSQEQIDQFADELFDELANIDGFQLDGLDIDMEQYPNEFEIKVSNDVIESLSKKIGPNSGNKDTVFLYDTNGSNLNPFQDVAKCFDMLAYQQYGSDSSRTQRVIEDYKDVIDKDKIMPGLTFPEEQDPVNRWYDATLPYETSNFYDVAKFVNENELGGMFVYALDRDGRNYEEDLNRIKPSNLLWTKTAILESNGVSLSKTRQLALHHLNRIKNSIDLTDEQVKEFENKINDAKNILDVNAVLMGYDYEQGISPTYDPVFENELMN